MSLMNGDHLEAIMKDQVEQLNTIEVAATAMGIDQLLRSREEPESARLLYVKICKYVS